VSRSVAAVLAASVLASACGASPGSSAPQASTPAPSGPRAVLPSGAVYALELALTPEDQAQGLMYRENLPASTGMLFVFPEPAPHHFYMKNTMIPLDIIWLDEAGRVIDVSADTPPCKADPCPTYGPDGNVRMVLELAGGMAKKEGVAVGSMIKLEGLP